MCIIEQTRYTYTDGTSRIVEKIRYCHRTDSGRLCNLVHRRETQQALIVERRPSTADGPSGNYMATESRTGNRRVYRDLSDRSSHGSSVRQGNMSDRSQPSIPSSTSSPLEAGPSLTSGPTIFGERRRAPYSGMPTTIVGDSGTAFYDGPPSLTMPRALENERLRPRRLSGSSMTAEFNDLERSSPPPATPSQRRRRKSVTIDPNPSINTPSSARPSDRAGPRRQDSHRSSRTQQERMRQRQRELEEQQAEEEPQMEEERRRQQEDAYQAHLERERLAASDRRQSIRVEQREAEQRRRRRETSRERHRRATTEALEGRSQRQTPMSPSEARQEAERAQMAREQAEANDRQRNSTDTAAAYRYTQDQTLRDAENYAQEQIRRDAEAYRQYWSTRRHSTDRTRPTSRRMAGDSSPTSTRSWPYRPVVHQSQGGYGPSRQQSSFSARGADVIARERARAESWGRAAREEMERNMGGMRIDDAEGEWQYDGFADEYVPAEQYGDYEWVTRADGRRERVRRRYI